MNKILMTISATAFLASSYVTTTAYAASPYGNWKRPNGSVAKIWNCGGKMCGKVVSGKGAGFTMFRGLKKTGGSVWKGDMKHPKMGSLFTFNGTVKLSGRSMHVNGCMIGGSMCDAETWRK